MSSSLRLPRAAVVVAACVVTACGDRGPERPAAPPATPVGALDVTPTVPRGRWDPVPSFPPHIAIHAHLLPNGRVLLWPGEEGPQQHKKTSQIAFVWDPVTGGSVEVDNTRTDVFCSGHAFLPDGRLLVTGGHVTDGVGLAHTNYFDYAQNRWSKGPNMAYGRWYPTSTVLANGEVLTISGTYTSADDRVRVPEVLSVRGTWRRLTGIDVALQYYPWMFQAPNGKVFFAGPGNWTSYVDPTGTGRWEWGPFTKYDAQREYGSAVMYEPGKVLIMGGTRDGVTPPTRSAERIDLNVGAAAAWQVTDSMNYGRRHMNATLLPDGRVLATGGTSSPGFNNPDLSVLASEVWDPATGTWTVWAEMRTRRLYHSTALLLPDGRVLSAGGGRPAGSGGVLVQDTDHPDAEVFSPPYLFAADGTPAVRPLVTGAPTGVSYGQRFDIQTPNSARIAKVTLVRLGSVTHTFDQNQRFLRLTRVDSLATLTAGIVRVTAPAGATLAPPGHYMLFLLDTAGVPSIARIVRIN